MQYETDRSIERHTYFGPQGVLGTLGEVPFILRELRSTDNYFKVIEEQAHNFWVLGSPAQKKKNKNLT